jgi:hypothetical protein
MIKRTTVRLPAELLRRAKRKADAEGRTLTALMEDGLRYVVSDKPAEKKKERIMPPVSTATGGQMPGVTTFKDLEELDDLDYIERLNRGFK